MYDDQRYEVECKYSQFVVLPSRPVWPRLDLAPLATLLNTLEARYAAAAAAAAGDDAGAAAPGQEGGLVWVANSLTDTGAASALCVRARNDACKSHGAAPCEHVQTRALRCLSHTPLCAHAGPMLRLQPAGQKLSKAKRYGHPYEVRRPAPACRCMMLCGALLHPVNQPACVPACRACLPPLPRMYAATPPAAAQRRIYSSSIPPRRMAALVQSFLGFGLQGLRPEPGGWDWSTLHEINQQIHWQVGRRGRWLHR